MKLLKRLTMVTKPFSLNASNRIQRGGKGVYTVKAYTSFKRELGFEVVAQLGNKNKIVRGNFGIVIEIGRKSSKADIDNLIKPIVDVLADYLKVLPNDRNMEFVNISRIDGKTSYIEIYGEDQGSD